MTTKITDGVQVTVESAFQPEQSSPVHSHYVFSYKVRIYNHSHAAVQLLRRHWHIYDSNGTFREVEGEGVVGFQPIIEPNTYHEYMSGCNFKTDIGRMEGTYTMKRINTQQIFKVAIPEFLMIVPFKLN